MIRETRKISIRLEMTPDECQLLLSGLKELIQQREEQARYIAEDCSKAAAQIKVEADILRGIKTETKRQLGSYAGAK